MSLYGFGLCICFTNNEGIACPEKRAVVLPQMYDLAEKYDLPELMDRIEANLKDPHFCQNAGFERWWWPMAQYIWTNDESATNLQPVMLELFRHYASQSLGRTSRNIVPRLSECPALAIDLLVSGGLDGSGLKFIEIDLT